MSDDATRKAHIFMADKLFAMVGTGEKVLIKEEYDRSFIGHARHILKSGGTLSPKQGAFLEKLFEKY